MSARPVDDPPRSRAAGLRGHIAGIVALAALAGVAAAWFWSTRQPVPSQDGFGVPHGVIVIGAGAFITAMIAEIRAMSLGDVLEMLWDLACGAVALVGAMFKAIWNGLLSLLGLD